MGRNLITRSNQAAWGRIQDEVRWNKGPPSLALTEDGFVRRKRPEDEVSEGSFIACTLWLADCQNMQGRSAEARQTLERVLAIRNDLGLLSEEYDVPGRHLAGNFPQALSHLALVTTALGLSGPVLQRGGG